MESDFQIFLNFLTAFLQFLTKHITLVVITDMAPFYEEICKELGWAVDASLLESMKQENAKTLASIEESVKDAEENLGETEIRDLLIKKAEHFSRIGDKVSET